MAHPNILERRAAVAEALIGCQALSSDTSKLLALKFHCSRTAIRANVIELTYKEPITRFVTHRMRREILRRDGGVCQYCTQPARMPVVEHVIPASRGGHAKPYNLVTACQRCNSIKGESTWVPVNLNAITVSNPDWLARVHSQAHTP